MPLAKIVCSRSAANPERLLGRVSRVLAEQLHKPEAYVMTCLEAPALMTFAGTLEPCAYVEIKNIGTFTSALTKALSSAITSVIAEELAVPEARVYIEFGDAQPHLWGHGGDTFA